jgi:hypothetical protein
MNARVIGIAAGLLLAACGGGVSSTPSAPPAAASAHHLTGFAVSGEQDVIPPGTTGLQFTPDEHISFLRQSDGSYKLFAAGGSNYGVYGFTTPDFLTLTSFKTNAGAPAGVFLPSGAGTPAYDADYAGSGTILTAANGTDLLIFYHAENHLFSGIDYQASPFYASVGLARSSDGGMTWTREGAVITGADPQQPTQAPSGAGALTPTAIEFGGFIYIIYREIDLQSHLSGLALARAPVSSDGAPSSFQKYHAGSFSTPGLGGTPTILSIVLDPTNGDLRQPHVSFNTYLNTFLMAIVGNGGIYVSTSPDLINWSNGLLALAAPVPDSTVTPASSPFNWYPTIVSPGPSDQVSGQTGFLYYAKSTGMSSQHGMYRQAYTITGTPP